MCYSAKLQQKIKEYYRRFDAKPDYEQFLSIFSARLENSSIRIPRAFEANFDHPTNTAEQQLHDLTVAYRAKMSTAWAQDLFAQKKRLADAQRKLATKETKAARNDERVATNKIEYFSERLADLKRTEERPNDSRIFPMHYAPIVINEGGGNRIVLARYHCRQADKPASIDAKFPGLYNARRDNIEKFWRGEFGQSHAIALVDSFYENVAQHDAEGRALQPGEQQKNLVLHFQPTPARPMLVACLYSRWRNGPDRLLSFAAITDEPPAEIAAAGHDRVIINIKEQNIANWLTPQERTLAELQSILDDVERPYYEHQVLAA